MLVEDDHTLRNIIATTLQKKGYEVIEAENGLRALEKFSGQEQSLNLVISDIVMPKMSGKILADELAKLQPELPVLFMSGYTANIIALQGIHTKQSNFLPKPFLLKDLLGQIHDIAKLKHI